LYPPQSFVHEVLIAFVLGGMVVGAAATLTPVYLGFVLFATCALLPLIARYFIAGDYIHYAMGGMGVFFLLAMLVIGKRIHDTIAESLKLRSENQELIVYLTNTSEHFSSLNSELIATQNTLTKANEALENRGAERTAALQKADHRKDEFLPMLSHELRNPLAAICNITAILNHGPVQPPQSTALYEMLQRQTRQLSRIVDDLLDVARITQGNIPIRKQLILLD
jgi:signal transduction histidine kinase